FSSVPVRTWITYPKACPSFKSCDGSFFSLAVSGNPSKASAEILFIHILPLRRGFAILFQLILSMASPFCLHSGRLFWHYVLFRAQTRQSDDPGSKDCYRLLCILMNSNIGYVPAGWYSGTMSLTRAFMLLHS